MYLLLKLSCVLIEYKFIFNKDIKHSSYLYQKVFRSICGYQQNVTKKGLKPYIYYRKGLLSNIPHKKYARNNIILPKGCEKAIIDYFETGVNPTHNWREKGNWNVDYKVKEIDIDVSEIIKILEIFLLDYKIINVKNKQVSLLNEISEVKNNLINNKNYINNKDYINNILQIMKNLINNEWFEKSKDQSALLTNFYNDYSYILNIQKSYF